FWFSASPESGSKLVFMISDYPSKHQVNWRHRDAGQAFTSAVPVDVGRPRPLRSPCLGPQSSIIRKSQLGSARIRWLAGDQWFVLARTPGPYLGHKSGTP